MAALPDISLFGFRTVKTGSAADVAIAIGNDPGNVLNNGIFLDGGFLGFRNNGFTALALAAAASGSSVLSTNLEMDGFIQHNEISAPAVSPANTGRIYFDDAENKYKVSENGGAYVDLVGGGGGTPAGSNREVQWNDNGAFGADANFFYVSGFGLILTDNTAASDPVTGSLVVDGGGIGLNGNIFIGFDLDMAGSGGSGPSSAGNGRIYFDNTLNKFRVSENGGAFVDMVGGGGTPGGADTQVQFNNAGAFAGDPGLSYQSGTFGLAVFNEGLSLIDSWMRWGFRFTSSDETVPRNHTIIYQDSGPINTTLWASPAQGDIAIVKNESGTFSQVIADGGGTIDGNASLALGVGQGVGLFSDGTNWFSFGTSSAVAGPSGAVQFNNAGAVDGTAEFSYASGDGLTMSGGEGIILDGAFFRNSRINVNGSSTLTRTVTAVKQTAASITTTLWNSPDDGDTVSIRNAGGGADTTVNGNGNNIDGAATLSLADGESATLIYSDADGEWTVF